MEQLIANIMENPAEARALFDIMRQLTAEAAGERFENIVGGVQVLDADTVRVVLMMLVSVTDRNLVDETEANFMRDIHPDA